MTETPAFDPVPLLANELGLPEPRVAAVVNLLADSNTVPFIARYRKELTGGMDEVQIRTIEERRAYLMELDDRRQAILKSIDEQGKLTDELRGKIAACTTKAALEDLYLPYKPKRRTRATAARERGLLPLAERILAQPLEGDPDAEAAAFVTEEGVEKDKAVPTVADALKGARDIVAEILAEKADVRARIRTAFAENGEVVSEAVAEKTAEPTKFEQYYDFREAVKTIPAHRFLAIRRGEAEGILRAHLEVDSDALIAQVEAMSQRNADSPFADQLSEAIADSYRRLLSPSVENDVRVDLKMRSDRAAVDVFADNVRNLLLAAPLGTRSVIGIDPGLRTGCKCAAVDQTGKFLGHTTFYLTRGDKGVAEARKALLAFIAQYQPMCIAVGNGTGGRETESFVRETVRELGQSELFSVLVNESGASVYSASDVAREEFPDLDLTIRGAISIARRLQDPLAELVKIEPKAIGVGQYQHDVHQPMLHRKLDEVVESCVNHVGVELNTASAPLLSYVAGIGKSVAKKIVAHREKSGAFASRQQLLDVSGLGPKAFEQSAGFLRIRGGAQVLDSSAVHPERYDLVLRIAADLGVTVNDLIGDTSLIDGIDIAAYVSGEVGEPTLRDILDELKKPGRDPRAEFEPPRFRADVNTIDDLQQGMQLEGVVTNVTDFGAFIDVGVHQDGLVHISQLSDRFVKDPREIVKVGDRIKVRVLDVDTARRRIALSARSESSGGGQRGGERQARGRDERGGRGGRGDRDSGGGRGGRERGGKKAGRGGGGRAEGGRRDAQQGRNRNDRDSRGGKSDSKKFSNNPFAKLADLGNGRDRRR